MIRWLFKWIFRLVALVVLLAVLLLVFKDTIIRVVTEHRIRAETGMEAKIRRVSVGLFSPVISIDDLRVYNTPEFGGGIFLAVPELHVEYDRALLMEQKFHITLMRLNLAEIDVVRNAEGRTNIVSMAGVEKKLTQFFPRGQHASKGEMKFDGIEVLNLSLGRARFVDLKDSSQNRDFQIGLKDEVMRNLKTKDDFYGAMVLVWLRHGSEMGISAEDIWSVFDKKKAKKSKAAPANSTKDTTPQ